MSFVNSVLRQVAVHVVADYATGPVKTILDKAVVEGNKLVAAAKRIQAKRLAKKANDKVIEPEVVYEEPEHNESESPALREMKSLRSKKRSV